MMKLRKQIQKIQRNLITVKKMLIEKEYLQHIINKIKDNNSSPQDDILLTIRKVQQNLDYLADRVDDISPWGSNNLKTSLTKLSDHINRIIKEKSNWERWDIVDLEGTLLETHKVLQNSGEDIEQIVSKLKGSPGRTIDTVVAIQPCLVNFRTSMKIDKEIIKLFGPSKDKDKKPENDKEDS